MRITPVNAFNNSVVNNNQNSQRYSSSVMKNQLGADTVQFTGMTFNLEETVKIVEALGPLRKFMSETRPYHNRLSALLSQINKVSGDKKSPVKIVNDFTESELAPLREAAKSLIERVPYKKTTILASEADSHLNKINDMKLMDLMPKDRLALYDKTGQINADLTSLEKDIQAFPAVKEEVNNLFNQNKDLISRLFS